MVNLDKKKPINKFRVFFALIYLIIPIIIVIIRIKTIFYINYNANSYNFDRFLWCLSSSLFGFSIIAFHLRYHEKNPFPSYITYYPFILLMMASLIFSILHIFNQTSGFVFYYISFSLCFILSFFVDNFFAVILKVLPLSK